MTATQRPRRIVTSGPPPAVETEHLDFAIGAPQGALDEVAVALA